jgi:cytochrome c553
MTFSARLATLAVFVTLGLAHSLASAASDAARGQTLAYTCLGCHGIPNYKNVYPTYDVPKLRGQHPEYIVAALKAYKSKERSHATMHAHAASMTEQDMADIAAFLSGTAVQAAAASATPASSNEIPKVAQTCTACHGTDGVGITVDYPTLSGQHASYLARSLIDYKRGGRRNPVMMGFASQLTDAEIEALAHYFARKQPSLDTVPRRATRYASR